MFPKLKPKKKENLDLNSINKTEFCDDHCKEVINLNENEICQKYLPVKKNDDTDEKKKILFTADGVYSYYKSFVSKLLEIIKYKVSFKNII